MNGPELLEHAAGLVARRRREYGEPVDVFEAVAKRWSLVFGTKVTAAQVVIALLDLKLTRLSRDPKHLDSIVDVAGYAANLERFDRRLAGLLRALRDSDLLVITADHGNDPATPSTDHSREHVPILVTGARVRAGVNLGRRSTFADLAQTLAEVFGVGRIQNGESFLSLVQQ